MTEAQKIKEIREKGNGSVNHHGQKTLCEVCATMLRCTITTLKEKLSMWKVSKEDKRERRMEKHLIIVELNTWLLHVFIDLNCGSKLFEALLINVGEVQGSGIDFHVR